MDRYRKLRSLGRGQSGEVWLVEREDASLAAMKQIFSDDEESKSLEVKALEKLTHPHIIQYLESFTHENSLCIVMDYAEGGDLASRIRIAKSKQYRFAEPQIWRWFMQICVGLSYIHERKIIHRDLKTQNIFLTKGGEIKIADFGICRLLSKSDELASTSVGTPYYIAPEVCRGEGYSYKADVWSLGCIVYELCSLRRPFEGENLATVINSILTKEQEPIAETYSDLMQSTVREMLSKDPAVRPTIGQVLTSINNHASGDRRDSLKQKKTYQKEISIKIPTPTHAPIKKNPSSAPSVAMESPSLDVSTQHKHPGTLTNRGSSFFNFSESLLKQCPSSPIRPMLMGDFLKRRLSAEVFERLKKIIENSKDPGKLFREEPWIFSDICGEENLSIIDVAIACGAFNSTEGTGFPNTSTNREMKGRHFPGLSRKASQ
jgi:NIMA (never in mitosis gene a)-related kinase 1/4/5